jgi:hypothetical protein
MVAIGKMDALATRQLPDHVLEWARRAVAHCRLAQTLTADKSLQRTAATMAQALEQAVPALREAATTN